MTVTHQDRANGESYFNIEDLQNVKAMVEFCNIRSQGRTMGIDYDELLRKIDREINFIERTIQE